MYIPLLRKIVWLCREIKLYYIREIKSGVTSRKIKKSLARLNKLVIFSKNKSYERK
jgi:hypothetical protein